MNNHIAKALETWYPKDHPLHLDPMHPAIKLAGEAGEILDQYGKHLYKPGRECTREEFLDELGDLWYYTRILVYQNIQNYPSSTTQFGMVINPNHSAIQVLAEINMYSAILLKNTYEFKYFDSSTYAQSIVYWLVQRLAQLDSNLDELTGLNYQKLNSDPTNHGWKGAGQIQEHML